MLAEILAVIMIAVTGPSGGQVVAVPIEATTFGDIEDCLEYLVANEDHPTFEDDVQSALGEIGYTMANVEPVGGGCYTADAIESIVEAFPAPDRPDPPGGK